MIGRDWEGAASVPGMGEPSRARPVGPWLLRTCSWSREFRWMSHLYVAAGKGLGLPREAARRRDPAIGPGRSLPATVPGLSTSPLAGVLQLCLLGADEHVPPGSRAGLCWCLETGCDGSLKTWKAAMPQIRALFSPTRGAGGRDFTGSLLHPTICQSNHGAAFPSSI